MNRSLQTPVPAIAARLRRLLPVKRVKDQRNPALSPDTLMHVGARKTAETSLHVVDYTPGEIRELTTTSIEECREFESRDTPTWIRVTGLHEVDRISTLLEQYGIHPLVQADILNTRQLPKADSFDEYLFVVLKLIAPHPDNDRFLVENFSLVLVDHLVITFQESPTPVFDPVLTRLRAGTNRLRQSGCDYLAWAILDAVVDHYLLVLDRFENEVEEFDELVLEHADTVEPAAIHTLKKQIYHLHRLIRPARDVAAKLARSEYGLIKRKTQIYFLDLYDHVLHAAHITELLRESVTTVRDFHLSAVNNRMNETMKVLTCFATIFLPLTFIAGIYGMNFRHMPELDLPWAYPALWALFLLLALAGMAFFRRKRWL